MKIGHSINSKQSRLTRSLSKAFPSVELRSSITFCFTKCVTFTHISQMGLKLCE